jgi:hypothetical protein
MSRDMQIGLLLAVGFIALVGGVLYYRIEHPDELENYLGGNQAQATAATPTTPGTGSTLAQNSGNNNPLPPPPTTAPTLENNTITFDANTPSPGNQNPVTLASGSSTGDTAKPIPTTAAGSPPAMPMQAFNDKKPVETKPNPSTTDPANTGTASRASLQTEGLFGNSPNNPGSSPPALTPPTGTAPAISLNVDGNSKPSSTVSEASKENKKPNEVASKTEPSSSTPPSSSPPSLSMPPANTSAPSLSVPPTSNNSSGIVMTDPSKKSEPEKKSDELPQPPGLPNNAPSLGGGLNFDINSKPAAPGSSTAPSLGNSPTASNSTTSPTQSSTPSLSSPPSFDKAPPVKDMASPLTTSPSSSPSLQGSTPLTTSPLGNSTTSPNNTMSVPETVIKPNNLGNTPPPQNTERGTVDGDNMRVYPVRAGLGKPMTETEAQNRERRWAETAGSPSPIVPSSASSFNSSGSGVSAPASTASDRRVIRDSIIPWEYATRGETFTSLSQRLYGGDTSYAAALAEFNKEHGFVTLDQPQTNQVIAKPNREILEHRYPHLIPRMKANTYTPNTNNANNIPRGTGTTATPAESLKTYRVAKGEQLFEVAKKTLGDGYRWSEIYTLNKDQLRDSTELRPDMVLKIPSGK